MRDENHRHRVRQVIVGRHFNKRWVFLIDPEVCPDELLRADYPALLAHSNARTCCISRSSCDLAV